MASGMALKNRNQPSDPGHDYVNAAAAAHRTDEPLAPFGDGGIGAVTLGYLGSLSLDVVDGG
jgi:hypothetical protein